MKLLECYIENFGKISKRKFDFTDGLNCILEENGSGKTTLSVFIKVMLYGMNDTKKQSLEENDRRHYLPWQGGICGGSLTFSAGGKTYRVERSFAAKAADDTYALYDTATGRISTDFPEGLGEGLFGIDADGFERTVFLSERALTPQSENKSISAKLSDLVGCDGDIGGMDEALKLLEEKRKYYYKKGGSGEIADTKARIDAVNRRLDALVDTERAAEESRQRLIQLSQRMEEARAEAKALLTGREEAMRRAAEVNYEKQYKEIKASLEESERRRVAVAAIFGADIPSHNEIDEANYKSVEAKNLRAKLQSSSDGKELSALTEKFGGVDRGTVEEARRATELLRSYDIQKNDRNASRAKRIFVKRTPAIEEIDTVEKLISTKNKKTPVGCIIAYILFALCCVIGVLLEQLLIAVGVVGILITLITEAIVKGNRSKRRKDGINEFFSSVSGVRVDSDDEARTRLADMRQLLTEDEGEDTDSLMQSIKELLLLFPAPIGSDPVRAAEQIIREFDRYSELSVAERYIAADRARSIERADLLDRETKGFLARFNTKTADPFTELRAALTEYSRLSAEIGAKRAELARLESLNSIGEGNQKRAEDDIRQLDKKRQENDSLMAELSREYTLTERAYNAAAEELDGRDELLMRRGELEELYQKHSDNYNTVLLTKKYLAEARDSITSKYLGKTKAGFIRYNEMIGGRGGEYFEMDTDFGITKLEGAVSRSVEAYSRGTRDLFNLSARLALIDSLYEKESPFILLDDPFTAFDDERTAAALRAIKEIAKNRQIIYFTCSKSRSV